MILPPWEKPFMRHGSTAAVAGLGGGYGVAGFTLSVLAADCLFADSVAICFGDLQSFNGRITHQTLEAVPIPEEYSPPQVLVDTDKYLGDESPPYSGRWLMHAVALNPSLNALATAMAARASPCVSSWK